MLAPLPAESGVLGHLEEQRLGLLGDAGEDGLLHQPQRERHGAEFLETRAAVLWEGVARRARTRPTVTLPLSRAHDASIRSPRGASAAPPRACTVEYLWCVVRSVC